MSYSFANEHCFTKAWIDNIESEFQGYGSPRQWWSSPGDEKSSRPLSPPHNTKKRSRREDRRPDRPHDPSKHLRTTPLIVAYKDMDISTSRETRSRNGRGRGVRVAAGVNNEKTSSQSQSQIQSPNINSPIDNRSSATTLTEATTLTYTSSQASAQSSSPPGKARSRSPAKKVTDLSAAVPPTSFSQLGANQRELPTHLRKLHREIIGAGKRGVLPSCLKEQLIPYLDEFDAENAELFGFLTETETVERERNLLKEIIHIQKRAQLCYEQDKPEASWGEEVIRPLLELALAGNIATPSRSISLEVTCENITSTKISPPTLIPAGPGIAGLPFEAKRVDYGLFIGPPIPTSNTAAHISRIASQISLRLRHVADTPVSANVSLCPSLNQSSATYIRSKVALAAVELKRGLSSSGGATDPLLQLAIWNSALFARLQLLRREDAQGHEMMTVPSLIVAGHRWEVCYTYLQEVQERKTRREVNRVNEERSEEVEDNEDKDLPCRFTSQTRIMLGTVDFGSTMDILGIYRIIRRLRAIAKYGTEEYWPWFEREMLWVDDKAALDS